jgi:hypothetical protein
MGLSLIVKQILGEIDNAAETLENKLDSDLLPALKGEGFPLGGSSAPSPGLQRPLGPGSWSYPGQHRGSPAPTGGLAVETPIFKAFPIPALKGEAFAYSNNTTYG